MKKGFWGFTALGFILTAVLLAAVPAGAQSVDEKIKVLEQELSALKEQQIDLKKEATAAAAALPSFSYRPGNGLKSKRRISHGAFGLLWNLTCGCILWKARTSTGGPTVRLSCGVGGLEFSTASTTVCGR